ncbi:MAG TPA: rhodanese-like domain-containing protein [Jatrophihabitans sp.]|jgi:rhodanese-related sulfurtransferase
MLPGDIPTVTVNDVPTEAVLLDVREPDEWAAGHIEGARHVPMFQVPQHVSLSEDLESGVPIVVVCKMGGRSAQVTAWLNQHGYDAVNLDGGMLAWTSAGRPMVSEDGAAPRVA